jgi:beta-lactam-binding protein with PASTA domain
VVLVLALVAAATAVAFGTGYRASRASLGDGGAYLQKQEKVVHVNADNRDVDAETAKNLATGQQTLEVVQVRPGAVFVVNNDTGEVSELPTDTLEPRPVDRRPDSKGKVAVVAGGGATYLVDAERGTVDQLERRGRKDRRPVPTPVRVDHAVVDPTGTAWAYAPESGELVEIANGAVHGRQRIAGAGERAKLTLVSNTPALYRPESGQAGLYGRDGLRRRLDLDARYGVPAAPGAASLLAVVVPATGELVLADFDSGDVRRIELPDDRAGHQFGPPVVHKGRIYVPDRTARHVLIVATRGPRVESRVAVPGDSTFEVVARDDRVWVNDPHSRIVLTFDAAGRSSEIDMSDGERVAGDRPTKRPTPPPTAVPPRRNPADRTPPRRPAPPALITVPDLVGADYRQACDRLAPDLRCVLVAQPDGDGETDQVLRTNPRAGSRIAKGSPVTVVYRGPAAVPDVAGMPSEQACQAIEDARLTCQEAPGGLAPDGTKLRMVTRQDPAPGSRADTGRPVTIVFPVQIEVPNLLGQPYDVACPVGLTCAPRDLGPGPRPYVVVAQSAVAGSGLDPGATLTLDHHSNPGVPDVRNMTPDQACATLQQVQLACGRNDNAQTYTPNVVLAQDPAPGTVLPVGTPVTITYESTAPVALHRWKKEGEEARYLAAAGGGPPGAGWAQQPDIGGVYPAGAVGSVDGLVQVYQHRCPADCGSGRREVGYYYSQQPTAVTSKYVVDGAAFSCFAQPVAGTKPLIGMFNPERVAWAFAPQGSWEYNEHRNAGYLEDRVTICHIWFGVPGFRPNG